MKTNEKKDKLHNVSNIRIFLKTWSGKIGLILLLLQIILAIFAVAYYKPSGMKEYTQSSKWPYLYPANVPPCWATKKAPGLNIDLSNMDSIGPYIGEEKNKLLQALMIKYDGVEIVYEYHKEFEYKAEKGVLPKDVLIGLSIFIGENATLFRENSNPIQQIYLYVYLERPDGLNITIYNGRIVGSGNIIIYGSNDTNNILKNSNILPNSINGLPKNAMIYSYILESTNNVVKKYNSSQELNQIFNSKQYGKLFFAYSDNGVVTTLNGKYNLIIKVKYIVNKYNVLENGQLSLEKLKQNNASIEITGFIFRVMPNCYGFFGTDTHYRPIGLGLLLGLPYAFLLGIIVTFVSTYIGALYGSIAGYFKDYKGEIMMRIVDIVNSLPFLPILIALSVVFKSQLNLWILAGLMIILFWSGPVIVVRSMALQISENLYVEAAKAIGAPTRRILLKHVFPQIFPYTTAIAVLSIPGIIVTEASLALLGFGDPAAPTWGKMLQLAYNENAIIAGYWWMYIFPGLALVVFSATFLLIGRALEPIVAPKMIK